MANLAVLERQQQFDFQQNGIEEIGRASCRERV